MSNRHIVINAGGLKYACRYNVPDEPLAGGGLSAIPETTATAVTLTNADMESGETGWSVDATGAMTMVSDVYHGGSKSMRLDCAAASGQFPFRRQSLPTIGPGKYRLRCWMKRSGIVGSGGVRVRLTYVDSDGVTNTAIGLSALKTDTDWYEFDEVGYIASNMQAGSAYINIGRYGTTTAGDAWFDDVRFDEYDAVDLDAFLLYPNFRGYLMYGGSQTIRLRLIVNDTSTTYDPVVTITYPGGSEVVAPITVTDLVDYQATVEIDASTWEAGEYRITASLGAFVYPYYTIRKLTAAETSGMTVSFDSNNVLTIHGEPTFPIGIYNTSSYYSTEAGWLSNHLTKMSEAPLNFLINYYITYSGIPNMNTYLSAQRTIGMNFLATINNLYVDNGSLPPRDVLEAVVPELIGQTITQEYIDLYTERYTNTLNSAANYNLGGYYVADEVNPAGIPKVFAQNLILRGSTPTQMALGIGINSLYLHLWRDVFDVIGSDPYPFVRIADNHPLSMVGSYTEQAVAAVENARPVWMVLQYFREYAGDLWPVQDELLWMAIMAIVEGARGVFYWSYGIKGLASITDPIAKEAKWQELVAVTTELDSFKEAMLVADTDDVIASVSEPTIRWKCRTAGGKYYVFCYRPATYYSDRSGAAIDVTFTFTDSRTQLVSLHPDTADWFWVSSTP